MALKKYLGSVFTTLVVFAVAIIGASTLAAQIVKGEQPKPVVIEQSYPSVSHPVDPTTPKSRARHHMHAYRG